MVVHLILATAGAACATCGRIGFARNAATTFGVSYRLEVTANFDEAPLFQSAPNRPHYVDTLALWLHGYLFLRLQHRKRFAVIGI
jgi:hypothetical protein